MLDDTDVVKAIVEYVNRTGIEVLILGATTRGGLLRYDSVYARSVELTMEIISDHNILNS